MGTPKKATFLLVLLNVVWAIGVFVLCTLPPSDLPRIKIPHIDKVAHFGFFFVQSLLLCPLLRLRTRLGPLAIITLSTLAVLFYGGLIEVLQGEFFNRSGDKYDLLADMAGGLAGAVSYPVFLRFFGRFFQKV